MARFSDEWLAELMAKNDILEVISGYVQLTKRGGRYWGPCPFHHERQPSFSVIPERGMFYCFSCKRGGGVIQFIMEMEKLSYFEAVAFLAERVGMPLPEVTDEKAYQQRREYKKRLCELMKVTARYYHEMLYAPQGKTALDYLQKRGAGGVISKFGLGYAPDSFSMTKEFLLSKGFSEKELLDAALLRNKDGHTYDVFRNRVMFPIINVMGDVIAFGGRVMGEGDPKYLNSPESMIFNKRMNLYALNIAKKQRDLKSLVLVEGYMDVISLASAGIGAAVASLGTSLTKEQAALIKRYVTEVYLCYDGDDAGQNAALRGVDILEKEGLRVRVMSLPDGLDPDDFIKKHGRDAFYAEARRAFAGTQFKLERLKKGFDLNTDDGKVAYCTEAARLIGGLKNAVEQERYVRMVAGQTGMSEHSIFTQAGISHAQTPDADDGKYNKMEKVLNLTKKDVGDEAQLIGMLMENSEAAKDCAQIVSPEDFQKYGKIFCCIVDRRKKGILISGDEIVTEISKSGFDLAEIAAASAPEGSVDKTERVLLLARRIRTASLRRKSEEAARLAAGAKGEERIALMRKVAELNREIIEQQQRVKD